MLNKASPRTPQPRSSICGAETATQARGLQARLAASARGSSGSACSRRFIHSWSASTITSVALGGRAPLRTAGHDRSSRRSPTPLREITTDKTWRAGHAHALRRRRLVLVARRARRARLGSGPGVTGQLHHTAAVRHSRTARSGIGRRTMRPADRPMWRRVSWTWMNRSGSRSASCRC